MGLLDSSGGLRLLLSCAESWVYRQGHPLSAQELQGQHLPPTPSCVPRTGMSDSFRSEQRSRSCGVLVRGSANKVSPSLQQASVCELCI